MSSTAHRPSARPWRSASSIPRDGPRFIRLGPVPGVDPRVVPFAAFIALLAATPILEGAVDARWLAVGRGLVAAALLAFFWRAYVELRSPSSTSLGDWLWAIGAGLGVAVAWLTLDAGWMRLGGESQAGFVPLRSDGSLDPLLVALRLFGFVLVVPVMEELFWRSFLMRWIERRDF